MIGRLKDGRNISPTRLATPSTSCSPLPQFANQIRGVALESLTLIAPLVAARAQNSMHHAMQTWPPASLAGAILITVDWNSRTRGVASLRGMSDRLLITLCRGRKRRRRAPGGL